MNESCVSFKYKPKPDVKATNIADENEIIKKETYAEILRANITTGILKEEGWGS